MLPFRPAAILFTGVVRNEGARAYLKSLNVPVMEMWGETDDPVDMLVSSPGFRGGELLGEHLGEQGYRRIAYVGHTNSRSSVRIDGVNAALQKYGCQISLLIPVEGTSEMEDGVAAFDQIKAQLPDVDAMMFGTDVLAAGALVRAQELGIAVPGQLGITGYGDLFFAGHTRPALTSIRTSAYTVGQTAGKMLLSRLGGHLPAERIIQVPVHLEVRGTTARRKT
jgi:LacI family gluconate utilization system Gnt-I transcriptional repressor